MAVTAGRVAVSSTAVALNTASTDGGRLILKNVSEPAADVDLGPVGVTAGAGFSLLDGETVTIQVDPGEVVYAIRSAAVDASIAVLRT